MSLKGIVEYRQHVEEVAREELAAITRELAGQMDAITRLEQKLGRVLGELAGGTREGLPADEAVALYRLAEALSSDIATARRLADALRTQKEAKLAILLAAARECKIVEKLAARRAQERERVADRREQQVSDEVSLRRWRELAATARPGNRGA
jgi:flagellar export protein FliJ